MRLLKNTKETRKNDGITLIALVITIILILIIAGVAIASLTGDNGLLKRATNAKTRTEDAQVIEQIQLAYSSALIEKYGAKDISSDIKSELEKIYGADNVEVSKEGETYKVTITGKGFYEIDVNGNVTKLGPKVSYTNEKIVTNSTGAGEDVANNSQEEGTELYIYFAVNLDEGTINSISPSIPFKITKNGTYNFTVNYTTDGKNYTITKSVIVTKYALRAGIQVGDYVNYTPKVSNTTYSKDKLGESYTGSTQNKSDITQETLKWRVLTIYNDGKIDLISNPTKSTGIYFKGATGYNNGVYILHDICKILYSNVDHNIEARSVSLEDFEDNMTYEGKTERNNYMHSENDTPYGKTNFEKWGTVYINKKYPNLYARENGSGIDTENGNIKSDGIKDTDKAELDLATGNNSYKTPEIGLTAKQTYYNILINENNFGDAYSVLNLNKTANDLYSSWVASRFVWVYDSNNIYFGIRQAYNCIGGQGWLVNSIPDETWNPIRIVVQLGTDVKITPSTTASNENGIPHTINW